jgi:predicted SAM-dependent methyltransferase
MKLNLGCGPVQPAGWINIDGSIRAWLVATLPYFDRAMTAIGLFPATDFSGVTYARLEARWPWPDGSIHAIYAGELLEHFRPADGEHFVRECLRVLRPGGVLRVRVPDNARFWENYVTEYRAARARPRETWTTEHTRWVEMFFRDICVERRWFSSYGHFHKWAYDDLSLISLLERVGFEGVDRRAFHDSAISDVNVVEVRDDLIVEGRRPAASQPPASV